MPIIPFPVLSQPRVVTEDNEVNVSIFADDTALRVTANTLKQFREKLQTAVRKPEQYCTEQTIKLNALKTVPVPFTYTRWIEN